MEPRVFRCGSACDSRHPAERVFRLRLPADLRERERSREPMNAVKGTDRCLTVGVSRCEPRAVRFRLAAPGRRDFQGHPTGQGVGLPSPKVAGTWGRDLHADAGGCLYLMLCAGSVVGVSSGSRIRLIGVGRCGGPWWQGGLGGGPSEGLMWNQLVAKSVRDLRVAIRVRCQTSEGPVRGLYCWFFGPGSSRRRRAEGLAGADAAVGRVRGGGSPLFCCCPSNGC